MPWIYPGLLWSMPGDEKVIYLTFDDGPVPGPTEFVLDQLQSASALATFFCIGDNVRKHPGVFRRILAEGHAVGNHTFNHLKGWNYSVDEYLTNVQMCTDVMLATAPEGFLAEKLLFRPPYGRITRRQIKALHARNIVMWDVLTQDYDAGLSAEKCLTNSIAATRPGSIVVFHDSLKAEQKLTYVLPKLIDHFAGKNFVFKSLPARL